MVVLKCRPMFPKISAGRLLFWLKQGNFGTFYNKNQQCNCYLAFFVKKSSISFLSHKMLLNTSMSGRFAHGLAGRPAPIFDSGGRLASHPAVIKARW
jgi:hypothetical protein